MFGGADLQECTKKQKKEGLGFGHDRISELPDDVIINILSFLPLRDAVSTGLLSSRWLDLWKHTPYLDFFDTDDIYRTKCDTEHGSWDVGTCKHVKMVNSVLESHHALFLKRFRLHFYANKSAQSVVTKWLGFVWSRQVESLDLNFRCDMQNYQVVLEDLLGEMRPMKYLQNLSLMMMKVRGEDISLFLKNCPFLRKLRIEESFLTSDVHISGATLALEDLQIEGCVYSESKLYNATFYFYLILLDFPTPQTYIVGSRRQAFGERVSSTAKSQRIVP
ncbi:F-box/FBD/LRR-repeat protein At3g52680-like [Salvia splendens]|uniref:F-box/FBD/LRR-repeat protein At3g52680-like n=1 Tax=Salvia splendens TaxID=180675 RepID=UPI001C267CD1|nr:F-box/FBD/LRR-repeat protein At3g52680-like [Salvia splendens]